MAIVNIKSQNIINGDAAVQTLNPSHLGGARKYGMVANAVTASTDSATSVMRLFRVHSSWRIVSLKKWQDVANTSAAYTVGLLYTAADGGAAVSAACYGSAISFAAADLTGTDLIVSAARGPDKVGQQVWQDAGLTADPNRWYDLGLTMTTPGSVGAKIAMECEYYGGGS